MRSIKINQPQSLHRSTAELGLQRALQFLRTVGTDPAIRTELTNVGFTDDDLKQGWTLVLKACSSPQSTAQFTPNAGPVADAIEKLAEWQSTMFLRAHAALRRLHAAQDAFVFGGVVGNPNTLPVAAVSIFLERLDALENSPERKSTRKADHAALATLDKRGVTKDERKQAKQLVHLIETTAAPEVTTTSPGGERTNALTDVYAWVQDWTDSARAVITRRDHLIRLGIGKRRARAVAAPINPTPAPSPTTPVVAQIATRAIAALPPKSNGALEGAIVLGNGGEHA